jgi:hypothetical protein
LRLEVYRRFLAEARELAGAWHALPRDVAAWWRARDDSRLHRETDGTWRIEGPAAGRARAASLCVAAPSGTAVSGGEAPLALEWTSAPTARHDCESGARREGSALSKIFT